MMSEEQQLTFRQRAMYGSAQFGLSAITEAQLLLFLFFYSSSADEAPGPFTTRKLIGYAMLFGRVVDALADPLVGNWSDRTRTRWGRRVPFFAGGLLPLCAVFVLTWTPPVRGVSWLNALYAAALFGAFNFLYTLVICPYLALMPDIARTTPDRLRTMAAQSVFNVLGVGVGMVVPFLLAARLGYVPMALILSAVVLAFALPTVFGPREREEPEPSRAGFFQAVAMTLSNKHFLCYIAAFSLQWMGLRMVLAAIPDYVTQVLGRTLQDAALVMLATLASALVAFAFVPALAQRWGRRRAFAASCAALVVVVPALAFVGLFPPLSPMGQMVVLMLLAGVPAAFLFVVPYTMLADIIEYDAARWAMRREAMYFGVQGFLVKLAWGLAGFITAQLLEYLGPSARVPNSVLGLRAVGPVAALFFLAAALVIRHYRLDDRQAGEPQRAAGV